ncbi:MAG: hypothetical protein IK137_00770 [Bacilli bacterium]|nr:hypothetical protein [Bacilli bacterium]
MIIVMNRKRLTDLIKKYQKEEMDFDGKVELVADTYTDGRDDYTVVKAVITGKLQLLDEGYDLTQEMNEDEIRNVIKFYMEKAGYKTGKMIFTSKQVYDEKYKQYDDYEGRPAFDNVEIEILQNTKKIGGI